jgi:hypothetical protein
MSQLLWTQKQDIGPAPRSHEAMVYDSARSRVVLFGGQKSYLQPEMDYAQAYYNDTWEWDGEFWTQVADIGPLARSGAAMIYDRVRARVVLFGGWDRQNNFSPDTWEWDGEAWKITLILRLNRQCEPLHMPIARPRLPMLQVVAKAAATGGSARNLEG